MINVPMLHRFLLLGFVFMLGAACGGATGGKLPVDHPMYEHLPPEVDVEEDLDDEEVEDEDADEELTDEGAE